MVLKDIYYKSFSPIFYNLLLILSTGVAFAYSFILVYKKYNNYEYGKFDLGNMTQMVHNTLNGEFMVLTDQFGTNMPRWGMSHVDPVVLLSIPFYLIVKSPLTLIFIQHIVIFSAVLPLFWLTQKYTKSTIASFLLALSYILYPANGYTLIWTGYHGISFVAPLMIWLVWFLNVNDYLLKKESNKEKKPRIKYSSINSMPSMFMYKMYENIGLIKNIIYWTLIAVMLIGKEEIGAILVIFSIFLFTKNKRLAVQTGVVCFVWFFLAFFIIIPHFSYLRQESVNNFIAHANVTDIDSKEPVNADNFFFIRYSYLGNSYIEMLKTVVTRPSYVYKTLYDQEKVDTVMYLIGPFGYVVIFGLFWLVSLPDLAITFLSSEPIFNIYNHRMAFVISTLFVSQIILFAYMGKTLYRVGIAKYSKIFFIFYSIVILMLTIYYSKKSKNPLFLSSVSFVENKLIARVSASSPVNDDMVGKKYFVGETRKAHIPKNSNSCLNYTMLMINKYNPKVYTGPDYLGDHTSMREVNAVFPARYWDADMIVGDIFEAKTIRPFGIDDWTFNRNNYVNMFNSKRYTHLYSCGHVNIFLPGVSKDEYNFLPIDQVRYSEENKIKIGKVETIFVVNEVPQKISINEDFHNGNVIDFSMLITSDSNWRDNVTFFTLENNDTGDRFSFVDYLSTMNLGEITDARDRMFYNEKYNLKLNKSLISSGYYKLFWGIGDTESAREIYLGDIEIVDN